MDDFADIEAAARHLPQPSIQELLRLRREAENSPPPLTTVPAPVHQRGGILRYHCPLACGWTHDENPGTELPGSLLLPADFTSADLSDALTSMAEVRHNNYRLRIEQAIADHFAERHPGR
ncbi:hypothetical protein [Streptomyces sp. NPDC057910]|uniref:hypothetical protein n=1 Tax=Streptomyces sp. NPDC057910 TaxID=3346278 RepID=UPI0036E65A13